MKNKVKEQLVKLREEIAALDGADKEARVKLESLIADIENQLEDSEYDSDGLQGQLEQAISRFETTHPTITGILNRIMIALGNMGV